MFKKEQKVQKEVIERGQGFTKALNVETIEQALATGNPVPVRLKIGETISEARYGGQENYLSLEILHDQLIFSSNRHPDQTHTIAMPVDYPVKITVIKHPSIVAQFISVEVYILLTVKNQDQTYQILCSDFPALPKLVADLKAKQINYTIPDYYQGVFAEIDVAKLQLTIGKDNRFASKLLPGLPPATQPFPLPKKS